MLLASSGLIKVTPGLMIWTIVCFAITFFILKRYAFGPIQKIIDERRERIHQSLAEADRARQEARKLVEEHRALIGQARREAEEIRADVRRDADRQRRLEETKRQIEAETHRALAQIRQEVAELTLLAATKVTGKVLDSKDQRRLIDEAIESLDFSALEEKTPA